MESHEDLDSCLVPEVLPGTQGLIRNPALQLLSRPESLPAFSLEEADSLTSLEIGKRKAFLTSASQILGTLDASWHDNS